MSVTLEAPIAPFRNGSGPTPDFDHDEDIDREDVEPRERSAHPIDMKAKRQEVSLIRLGRCHITVKGTSSLLNNKYIGEEVLAPGGPGGVGVKKPLPDPTEQFRSKLRTLPGYRAVVLHDEAAGVYYAKALRKMPDGTEVEGPFVHPSISFMKAAIRSAKSCGINMTDFRTAVQMIDTVVPIQCDDTEYPGPILRPDIAISKQGTGSKAVTVYRPEFREWSAVLKVYFDADRFSSGTIVSVFRKAGIFVGIGAWRPECDGIHGRFGVVSTYDLPEEVF